MAYSFTGRVKKIHPTQTVGTNGFQKRSIIVEETGSKFGNPIPFLLKKDKCELADRFAEGDEVEVSFVLSGREWESPKDNQIKNFLDLTVLKIDKAGQSGNSDVPPPADPPAGFQSQDFADTDVPF